MRFGQRIRAARRRARKSLEDVAGEIELSIPYLSQVERGVRPPFSPQKIRKLAEYLGDDSEELLALAGKQRRTFEFDATSGPEARRAAGAALWRGWDEYSPDDFEKITSFLESLAKGKMP